MVLIVSNYKKGVSGALCNDIFGHSCHSRCEGGPEIVIFVLPKCISTFICFEVFFMSLST